MVIVEPEIRTVRARVPNLFEKVEATAYSREPEKTEWETQAGPGNAKQGQCGDA